MNSRNLLSSRKNFPDFLPGAPGFDAVGENYIRENLSQFLPQVEKTSVEAWSGFRPRTQDRLPWMGWIDADRGWAVGEGALRKFESLSATCPIA